MNQLNVSIFIRNDVLAIVLSKEGMLLDKQVEYIKDETIRGSVYLSLLYGIKKSLLKVRQYLQNNPEIESVVFEVNNSTVVSWLQNYYSKEAYQDSFVEVIRLLQEIPMQYAFVVNPKPKAMRFADKKFIVKKLVVSSFNLDEFEE
jgi:hypothetical protein